MSNKKRTPQACEQCLREGWIRGLIAGQIQDWYASEADQTGWVRALQALDLPSERGATTGLGYEFWEQIETPADEDMRRVLEETNAWSVCSHRGRARGNYPESRKRDFHWSPPLFGRGRYTLLRALPKEILVTVTGIETAGADALATARNVASMVASEGAVLVGSLEHPVQREAIDTAVEAGGKVVAFRGESIDAPLIVDGLEKNGLLLSCLAPGARSTDWARLTSPPIAVAHADLTVITEYEEIPRSYTPVDMVLHEPGRVYMDTRFAGCREIVDRYSKKRGRSAAVVSLGACLAPLKDELKWLQRMAS